MSAPSAKGLMTAIKPKRKTDPRQVMAEDWPVQSKPKAQGVLQGRDPLDFDPTPSDATHAVLAEELPFLLAHGDVIEESAVGAGHIARVLQDVGFDVCGFDLIDRGWPGVNLGDFFKRRARSAPIQFTNPPYGEISAGNSGGRWLRHSLDLGYSYIALLLGAEWPFGLQNGFDALLSAHPPSIEYACTWKIDFRGQGNPAQRNCWFVWDVNRPGRADGSWIRKRLYRDGNVLQGGFQLEGAA